MRTWRITIINQDERLKADTISNYAPEEELIEIFQTETDRGAEQKLRKGIKTGKYPKDAKIFEMF